MREAPASSLPDHSAYPVSRRAILQTSGATLGALLVGGMFALPTAAEAAAEATAEQRRGTSPTPHAPPGTGKPGEFDFLQGSWNISHRFRKFADKEEWDLFKGEATCWTILAGVCSVEELRIPDRGFSGLGLRLLEVEKKIWSDFWVNAKSGVLTSPGTTGSFVDGTGIFISDEKDGETPIKIRGMWDNISKTTCRWTQSVSRDDGKSWRDSWIMDWTRA
ncbi:MAG: hypothetical protein ACKVS7_10090 [Gemmatimonadaceae bacterium]